MRFDPRSLLVVATALGVTAAVLMAPFGPGPAIVARITADTPEAQLDLFIGAVERGEIERARSLWVIPGSYSEPRRSALEARRLATTEGLARARLGGARRLSGERDASLLDLARRSTAVKHVVVALAGGVTLGPMLIAPLAVGSVLGAVVRRRRGPWRALVYTAWGGAQVGIVHASRSGSTWDDGWWPGLLGARRP